MADTHAVMSTRLPPVPSQGTETDTVPFMATQLPVWLLIFFISSLLLLAWLFGFHYPPFIPQYSFGILIRPKLLLSRCLRLIDLQASPRAQRLVNEVTYSWMIDIFIRKQCFKTLSIYFQCSILWHSTCPNSIHHRWLDSPRSTRLPSISLKDRTEQIWGTSRCDPGGSVWGQSCVKA